MKKASKFRSSVPVDDGFPSSSETAGGGDVLPMTVRIERVLSSNAADGFYVVTGRPVSAVPSVPDDMADYAGDLRSRVVVKGKSPRFQAAVSPVGQEMTFNGSWTLGPRGVQFESLYITDPLPSTELSLRTYLSSGKLPHIGPSLADKIIRKYGIRFLDVLDSKDVESVASLPGLNEVRAQAIVERWAEKKATYALTSFLGAAGIGETLSMSVAARYGNMADVMVRANPFLLLDVPGIGFAKADAVAEMVGISGADPRRVAAYMSHSVDEISRQDGDTVVAYRRWISESISTLGCSHDVVAEAAESLEKSGKVVVKDVGGVRVVASAPLHRAEQEVARLLVLRAKAPQQLSRDQVATTFSSIYHDDSGLDPSQKAALFMMLTERVSVMTGGPGTGKTTTLRATVNAAKSAGKKVVMVAPTGRAAKRMEAAVGEKASTIHMSLGFSPDGGFAHNASNPVMGDLFIVDEMSMVDAQLMCSWVDAIPPFATIVMVGDADQLPSVGPGDVLRDVVASGAIPVSTLTKVHRQAEGSGIGFAAAAIRAGQVPDSEDGSGYGFIPAHGEFAIRDRVVEEVRRKLASGVPAEDIQVLCPQRTRAAGVYEMNEQLRPILNAEKGNFQDLPRTTDGRFAVGDRIMQTKNNYTLGVFNGEMGVVTDVDGGDAVVDFEGRGPVTVGAASLVSFELGFATTVHKSQGGERPVVIMPISSSHGYMLTRKLVYTGVTRAKDAAVLVGEHRALEKAVADAERFPRTTSLAQNIRKFDESLTPENVAAFIGVASSPSAKGKQAKEKSKRSHRQVRKDIALKRATAAVDVGDVFDEVKRVSKSFR